MYMLLWHSGEDQKDEIYLQSIARLQPLAIATGTFVVGEVVATTLTNQRGGALLLIGSIRVLVG